MLHLPSHCREPPMTSSASSRAVLYGTTNFDKWCSLTTDKYTAFARVVCEPLHIIDQPQRTFQLIWDAGLRADGHSRYWYIPDILSIFSDCAIGGKPAHSGNVQDRSLPPARW